MFGLVRAEASHAAACDDARAEYAAVGGWDVLLQTGASQVDFGGVDARFGKSTADASLGEAVCVGTEHGVWDYLYTWIYRDPGTYTIHAPGFCTRTYTKGSGQQVLICTEPGQDDDPKLRALRRARQVLQQKRMEMLDAIDELERANQVFCVVSGQMLKGLKNPKVVRKSWKRVCGKIPDLVSALVDAKKKLERNQELIERLDELIAAYESGQNSARLASASPIPPVADVVFPVASAAKGPKALETLSSERDRTLTAIQQLAMAAAGGDLGVVRGGAVEVASRLSSIPGACDAARRYLKKKNLSKRVARGRIVRQLRKISPKRLSPRLVRYAKRLGLSKKAMKRRVRSARGVPKSEIQATAGKDLVCHPGMEAIDASIASSLQELAGAL